MHHHDYHRDSPERALEGPVLHGEVEPSVADSPVTALAPQVVDAPIVFPAETGKLGHSDTASGSDPHEFNDARAGGLLGSPRPSLETGTQNRVEDDSVRNPSAAGGGDGPDAAPLTITSTAAQVEESAAFFQRQKAAETREQKTRARMKSSVFSIMQYRWHAETGEIMLTQEQLDDGLTGLEAEGHAVKCAYIFHDSDRVSASEAQQRDGVEGDLKPVHCHMVLKFTATGDTDSRVTIRTVSEAFKIPSARVRVPKEGAPHQHMGRGAAEKTFFDFALYLTHEGKRDYEKYRYSRNRVVANFDFSAELDDHMATRGPGSAHGKALFAARNFEDLREKVLTGQVTKVDIDLSDEYLSIYGRNKRPIDDALKVWKSAQATRKTVEARRTLGAEWRKSAVLITGARRAGKDALAQKLLGEFQKLAAMAGHHLEIAKPAGRNALEEIGTSGLVHHDDARYYMVPGYDTLLRYLDPNQITEVEGRFENRSAAMPRLTVLSTSNTLYEFGLTTLTRKSTQQLEMVEQTGGRPTSDIDEFLLRLGWIVEVQAPQGIDPHQDFGRFCEEVVVGIYRAKDRGIRRVEQVKTRTGSALGYISTSADLDLIGLLKGLDRAARFLALEVMHERNQDILRSLPEEVAADLEAEQGQLSQEVASGKTREEDRLIEEAEAAVIERFERELEQQREAEVHDLHLRAHLHVQRVGAAASPAVKGLAEAYTPGPWDPVD